MIDKKQWQSLVQSDEFKFYQEFLKKLREDIKEQWAKGSYTDVDAYGTVQKNAYAMGKTDVLDKLLDKEQLTYEEITEYLSEE